MKKVFFTCAALGILMMSNTRCYAQDVTQKGDSLKVISLEDIVVSTTRVAKNAPTAYSNLNEQQLKKGNSAKNIPYLLQALPSVVAYSEGGTAVGNTSFRIRGTDANRINVTLNGMPLNNPESQEVYWVNLPDISNSLHNLQVQRGIGTSTTGSPSFGASISMQTIGSSKKRYADISTAYGSYNTMLISAGAGTGILPSGFSADARYSYTKSDGYIRNGKVDHKNIYAAISHNTDKQLLRFIYINGIQHTGITWEGVDPLKMEEDRRYNKAGKYTDDNGKTQYYDNETDNYYSNIVQAIYSRHLTNTLTMNANIAYTNGYGYYENYKVEQEYSDFGLANQTLGGVTYETTDLIRQKRMENDLYAGGINLGYEKNKLSLTLGTTYSYFDGSHYGKLLWLKQNENIPKGYEWYSNDARKEETTIFLKTAYRPLQGLAIFGEIQGRHINYKMAGIDDDLANISNTNKYNFVNPKIGVSLTLNSKQEIYASAGISNREPLRADLKESIKGGATQTIQAERLYDYETGYKYTNSKVSFNANLYYMHYKNQLILTGKLNDVGYKLQENVPTSYRTGIELSVAYTPTEWLEMSGNIGLSRNKIKDYTAYYDYYDNQTNWKKLKQTSDFYKSTSISFSPNITGTGTFTFIPFEAEDIRLSFINKYVGAMYYDNTSNDENRLPAYLVTDFLATYSLKAKNLGKIDFQLSINNLTNMTYEANAWVETIKFADGTSKIYKGLFPQAGINMMGSVRLHF